jgi:hypothetical protein
MIALGWADMLESTAAGHIFEVLGDNLIFKGSDGDL